MRLQIVVIEGVDLMPDCLPPLEFWHSWASWMWASYLTYAGLSFHIETMKIKKKKTTVPIMIIMRLNKPT